MKTSTNNHNNIQYLFIYPIIILLLSIFNLSSALAAADITPPLDQRFYIEKTDSETNQRVIINQPNALIQKLKTNDDTNSIVSENTFTRNDHSWAERKVGTDRKGLNYHDSNIAAENSKFTFGTFVDLLIICWLSAVVAEIVIIPLFSKLMKKKSTPYHQLKRKIL